jgi:hypothetical protein
MINLDDVNFQHKTVIYFLPNTWQYSHNFAFCKDALRIFHVIAWLILLAHGQTNFPPVSDWWENIVMVKSTNQFKAV